MVPLHATNMTLLAHSFSSFYDRLAQGQTSQFAHCVISFMCVVTKKREFVESSLVITILLCFLPPELSAQLTALRCLNSHIASWRRVSREQQLDLSAAEHNQ